VSTRPGGTAPADVPSRPRAHCSICHPLPLPVPLLRLPCRSIEAGRAVPVRSRRDHRACARGAGTLAASYVHPPLFLSVSLYAAERVAAIRYVASRWCPAAVRGTFYFWAVRTYGLDAGSELLGARVYLLLARIRDSLPFAWYGQAAASPVHCFRGKGRDPTVACACKLLGKVNSSMFIVRKDGRYSSMWVLVLVDQIRSAFLNFEMSIATTSCLPIPLLQYPMHHLISRFWISPWQQKTLVTEEFQWKHTAGRFSVLDLLSIVTLFSFLLARVSGTPDPYIQRFNRRWTIDGAAVCRSCSYCPSCVTQLVSAAQPLWR
jgi:hypothetical protein